MYLCVCACKIDKNTNNRFLRKKKTNEKAKTSWNWIQSLNWPQKFQISIIVIVFRYQKLFKKMMKQQKIYIYLY